MEEQVYVVDPSSEHTHTIVFLHGRDSNASEFASELFESQASDGRTLREIFPGFKWVFPNSGLRPSNQFDCDMSQWFDMWSVQNPEEQSGLQTAGLRESIDRILDLIKQEASELPTERIFLAGISQGCAVAIHALLCSNARLAGFLGFCSWLPFAAQVEEINASGDSPDERLGKVRELVRPLQSYVSSTHPNNMLNTPVFLAHCEDDAVVPISNGESLKSSLSQIGLSVEWHQYQDGGHWLNEPRGINDIVAFVTEYRAG